MAILVCPCSQPPRILNINEDGRYNWDQSAPWGENILEVLQHKTSLISAGVERICIPTSFCAASEWDIGHRQSASIKINLKPVLCPPLKYQYDHSTINLHPLFPLLVESHSSLPVIMTFMFCTTQYKEIIPLKELSNSRHHGRWTPHITFVFHVVKFKEKYGLLKVSQTFKLFRYYIIWLGKLTSSF